MSKENEALSGDDAAYAALQAELGDAPEQTEVPAPVEEKKEPDPAPVEDAAKKEADKAALEKLPYEEVERRYKNLGGALAENRAETKALRDQLSQMREVFQAINAKQQQAVEAEQFPDPLERELRTVKAQTEELAAAQKKWQDQQQARAVEDFVMQHVTAAENQFRAKTADYNEAVEHLRLARINELAVIYPDDDPQAVQIARSRGFASPEQFRAEVLRHEAMTISQQALQSNRNPAEIFYNLAKQRGWAGPKPAAAPVAEAPKVQKIDVIREGMKAPGSLSNGATSSGSEGLPSLEELADMYISAPAKADAVFKKMKAAGLLG